MGDLREGRGRADRLWHQSQRDRASCREFFGREPDEPIRAATPHMALVSLARRARPGMSRRAKRVTLRPPQAGSYEVGYGKPPVATQFKKGQSGNTRGRPKGRRQSPPDLGVDQLRAIILSEAYRTITVNDGDHQVSISMAQAIVRSMAVSAAKGQARSQRLFAQLLGAVERDLKESAGQVTEDVDRGTRSIGNMSSSGGKRSASRRPTRSRIPIRS